MKYKNKALFTDITEDVSMEKINDIISRIDSYVWGLPLIILIMVCGILLTVRLRFVQNHKLGKALEYMVKNEEDGSGDVSSFAALCTALSATVGTGNIVGVATAIAAVGQEHYYRTVSCG